ncbi:MAG: hypothetical protein H7Z42_05200 [Roseiflexaceae bacterium]|nr:hypothetical protein [Roseiflexaceae bacterium]
MSRSILTGTTALPRAHTARSALRWRADLYALLALALLGIGSMLLAYQRATVMRLDVGTSYAAPYLNDFFKPEQNDQFDYAYSGAESEIRLPGIGAGVHTLLLRVSGWRPEQPEPALLQVYEGQRLLGSFHLADQTQVAPETYRLALHTTSGNALLRLTTSTFTPSAADQRPLGVLVDWVELHSHGVAPEAGQLLHVLLIGLLAYTLARQLGARPLVAFAIALVAVVGVAWLLADQRLWWTIFTRRLWGLLLGICLAVPLLERALPWLWRVGGVAFSARQTRWLIGILAVAAVWKIGGVLYPQIIVYDQRYHVPRTEMVLAGDFLKLLVPSDVTALSVTVGFEGGHLPYSPLWYLLAAPWGLFGGDLGIASNALNGVVDVSRSILIAYLALRLFENPLAALWAAGVYHLFEMPYYLISWGNWPTQLGLWGGLFFICVIAATAERASDRRTLALLGLGALVAIGTYTVMGVIAFAMVAMMAAFEWLRRTPFGAQRGWALLLALLIGEAIAFGLYHIWYVPVIWAETVPALVRRVTEPTPEMHGEPRPAFFEMIKISWDYTLNHMSWPAMLLIPVGGYLAFRQAKRGRLIMLAWLAALVVFSIVDAAIVAMIFKHIFFTLPLFALFLGVLFAALWHSPRLAARLVPVGVCLYLASFVAERWWFYIMEKRHSP